MTESNQKYVKFNKNKKPEEPASCSAQESLVSAGHSALTALRSGATQISAVRFYDSASFPAVLQYLLQSSQALLGHTVLLTRKAKSRDASKNSSLAAGNIR